MRNSSKKLSHFNFKTIIPKSSNYYSKVKLIKIPELSRGNSTSSLNGKAISSPCGNFTNDLIRSIYHQHQSSKFANQSPIQKYETLKNQSLSKMDNFFNFFNNFNNFNFNRRNRLWNNINIQKVQKIQKIQKTFQRRTITKTSSKNLNLLRHSNLDPSSTKCVSQYYWDREQENDWKCILKEEDNFTENIEKSKKIERQRLNRLNRFYDKIHQMGINILKFKGASTSIENNINYYKLRKNLYLKNKQKQKDERRLLMLMKQRSIEEDAQNPIYSKQNIKMNHKFLKQVIKMNKNTIDVFSEKVSKTHPELCDEIERSLSKDIDSKDKILNIIKKIENIKPKYDLSLDKKFGLSFNFHKLKCKRNN